MTVVTYILGAVALVIIILGVAVIAYAAGKRQAAREITQVVTGFVEGLQNGWAHQKSEDAPKE